MHASAARALGNDTVFINGRAFVGYDSNVFRIADGLTLPESLGGPDKSDMYYGLGAGIRLDLPVSRQRYRANAYVNKTWYNRFTGLDYTGYGGRVGWDWRAGNDWHGQLGAGMRQSQQTLTDQLGFTIPRLLKSYDALATARYALTPRWELQAGAAGYWARYNEEVFRSGDFESTTWDLGAAYRTPRGNSTGFRLRYEEGRWPNRGGITLTELGGQYQQFTLSTVLDWRLTGRSRLYGDVGYTWRTREEAQQGDFNGVSGRLNYDYSLSGKTTLRASIYQIRGPTDADFATYVRTTGTVLSAIHQLTGKVELRGSVAYSEADYVGEAQVAGQTREFEYWTISVNGVYRVTRTINLSGGLSYYSRDSNLPFGDYSGYTANLNLGAEF